MVPVLRNAWTGADEGVVSVSLDAVESRDRRADLPVGRQGDQSHAESPPRLIELSELHPVHGLTTAGRTDPASRCLRRNVDLETGFIKDLLSNRKIGFLPSALQRDGKIFILGVSGLPNLLSRAPLTRLYSRAGR